MNNNTPDGAERSNATMTVNGFSAASNLTGTPTNENDAAASPSGEAVPTQSNIAMGELEIPPPADAGVVEASV